MLNDSYDYDHLQAETKRQLSEMLNSTIPIGDKYLELFKEWPATRVKAVMDMI